MDNIYIEKVLNGDTDAFLYFVNRYKDFAFSLSYSILKSKYLAEEVVQESFISSFEKLAYFKKKSSFKTWFGRIVINKSLRRISKRDILPVEDISEALIKTVEDTIETISKNEQKRLISEVFDLLQPNESLVLELFYLKEKSIKEIVELTSWSESKIKMLLLRGRKNFYSKLNKMLKTEIKYIL
jgi:RNA polymerase sigma-70 factor (ECF subfamily)